MKHPARWLALPFVAVLGMLAFVTALVALVLGSLCYLSLHAWDPEGSPL